MCSPPLSNLLLFSFTYPKTRNVCLIHCLCIFLLVPLLSLWFLVKEIGLFETFVLILYGNISLWEGYGSSFGLLSESPLQLSERNPQGNPGAQSVAARKTASTPDALSGAVWRAEIMVWRRKCWCLHFPNLAQTSSLSLVDFGATEAALRRLKCTCDCF